MGEDAVPAPEGGADAPRRVAILEVGAAALEDGVDGRGFGGRVEARVGDDART